MSNADLKDVTVKFKGYDVTAVSTEEHGKYWDVEFDGVRQSGEVLNVFDYKNDSVGDRDVVRDRLQNWAAESGDDAIRELGLPPHKE